MALEALPESAVLEGPIAAELSFASDPYRGVHASLQVTSPLRASVPMACGAGSAPELASDGAARLAYRCGPSETWGLVYVGRTRLFERCTPSLGDGATPDFARAPETFVDAAGSIAACMPAVTPSLEGRAYFPALLEDAEHLGLDALQRALLDAIAHEGALGWETYASHLPSEHPGWHEALVEHLREEPAVAPRTCRAAMVLGAEDPAVLERIPALIPDIRHGVCAPAQTQSLFENLHVHAPESATALSCAALRDVSEGDPGGWTQPPLHHLASTPEARCDLQAWVEALRCHPAMRCGDHLCHDNELQPSLDAPDTMNGYHAILAVAYRNGPLPEAWSRLEHCGDHSPE